MPKKKAENPFELYDFDSTNKIAYLFPKGWSEEEKMTFRTLSREEKHKAGEPGPGFVRWNDEEFRVVWLSPGVLKSHQ